MKSDLTGILVLYLWFVLEVENLSDLIPKYIAIRLYLVPSLK